ncbi:hypothetical protein HPB51_009700 [Rhipicephalus microplus]|uniref:Uncharacterized protein n=1 Tax=Rhipicephalus microplus TaxID=6941 RepID=A0A9J6ES80_RHIMP|nr:hypothetical protein HPB51_009700 [Rhipicephalus microplus]
MLWQCGLGLREDSPGELSLGIVRIFYDDSKSRKVMETVAKRLHFLLARHHCVTSLEMRVWTFWRHDPLMYDALRRNLGLRKLKLILKWSYGRRPPAHNFGAALLHLKHLQELVCEGERIDRIFIKGLSKFLASSWSLTALNLSSLYIKYKKDADAILHGLRRNKSIDTLSINTSLLHPLPYKEEQLHFEWKRYGFMAADYLRRNRRLRTLSIASHLPLFSLVRPIIETLLDNRYITKLSIIKITLEPNDIELINQLIIQNKTLTSFNIIKCRFVGDAGHITGNAQGVPSCAHSFLLALTKNKTLQQLTLTPSWFHTNECRSLVEAVASHVSLKEVNFDVSERKDAHDIYRAVRDSGAQDRFHLRAQCILPENEDENEDESLHFFPDSAVAFMEVTGPSGVSVDSQVFNGSAQLLTTLTSQPSCSHVNSLSLFLTPELLNVTESSVIAEYLRSTTTLRDLELRFNDIRVARVACEVRRELIQALSVNKGVRRLGVYGSRSDEHEVRLLADTLLSSRTLYYVTYCPLSSESVIQLVRILTPNLLTNYTLVSIKTHSCFLPGSDWLPISYVLHRNCGLVKRALDFVRGAKHKYCAEAAELVQFNPRLVEKVQELIAVDENEAAFLIKARLMKTTELNDFMRLAGVVKHGVTCHSRDDGKKQLVDIGRDCWLYIRQYLKLSDVLNEQ